MKMIFAILAVAVGLGNSLAEVSPTREAVEKTVAAMGEYEQGKDRAAVTEAEKLARETAGNAELRAALEGKLVELIGKEQVGAEAKYQAARILWVIGSESSVGVLEKLLADEKTVHVACCGLNRIPGAKVTAALEKALANAQGRTAVTILDVLGSRGDASAAAAMVGRLSDKDAAVIEAAASALARIGTANAAKAIGTARKSAPAGARVGVSLAYLQCAQRLAAGGDRGGAVAIIREVMSAQEERVVLRGALACLVSLGGDEGAAALSGALAGKDPEMAGTALAAAARSGDAKLVEVAVGQYPKLSEEVAAIAVEALGPINAPGVKEMVASAARGPSAGARLAALRALGRLGGEADVALLVAALTGGASADEKAAAGASLRQIKAPNVAATTLAAIGNAPAAEKIELLKVLADRGETVATAELLKWTGGDAAVAAAALDAAGALAPASDVAAILAAMSAAKEPAARRSGELAAIAVALRNPDPARRAEPVVAAYRSAADIEARCSMLRVLGGIANPAALEVLKEALKDGEAQIADCALRSLTNWPDTAATPLLLAYARTSGANNTRRALAVRGALRQLAAAAPTADKPGQLAEWFIRAETMVRGVEEKRLLLSGLAALKDPEALRMVKPYLDDSEVSGEAAVAAVAIVWNLGIKDKAIAGEVIDKAIARAKDGRTKQQATVLKSQLK